MKIKTQEKIRCLKKVNYENICLNDFEKFKGLKAIIFDFDNTLYKDIDWLNYNEFVVENVRKIFAYLTDEEFEHWYKVFEHPEYYTDTEVTESIMLKFFGL